MTSSNETTDRTPLRRGLLAVALSAVALLATTAPGAVAADPSFEPPRTVSGAAEPHAVAIADLDGDGNGDLAVADRPLDEVRVSLGDGEGGFEPAGVVSVPGGPRDLATGDLNGDGATDLVTANAAAFDVSVLLNDGSGGFSVSSYNAGAFSAQRVAVSDLDGGAAADVVVTALSPARVALLSGDGAGGLGEPVALPTLGSGHEGVAAADLNGDGNKDLVVVNTVSHDFTSMLGDGQGGFSALRGYGTGGQDPSVPALADFDGDGVVDVAVPNGASGSSSIGVRLGSGDGSFGDLATYSSGGANPADLVAADLDLDGDPDLAAPNLNGSNVGLLVGGGGAFQPAAPLVAGPAPGAIAAGDLNGDGADDLAVADLATGNVQVHLNAAGDATPPVLTLPAPIVTNAVAPSGVRVEYQASASDDRDPAPQLTCDPPSGATFAIGVTTVECIATDAAGNEATGSFEVTVRGAADQLREIVRSLGQRLGLGDKHVRALIRKLDLLLAAAERSGCSCRLIDAFVKAVSGHDGRVIPASLKPALIADLRRVSAVLACADSRPRQKSR